jgi:uncharacterized membrane-anchored protein YhcB (DUF1043 family)
MDWLIIIGIIFGFLIGRLSHAADPQKDVETLDQELKDEVVRLRKQVADLIGKE